MPNIHGVDLAGIGAEAEALVAEKLRALGHKVTAGESYRHDLFGDDSVRVEVKFSYPSDGEWVWAFNSRKRLSDYCDVVVLIGEEHGRFHFFVLPSDRRIFYTKSGKPKADIGSSVKPTRLRATGRALNAHRDKWQLISETRDGERPRILQRTMW